MAKLKKRIKATKGVKKTTRTMELISSVYLRKYQEKARHISAFTQELSQMKDIFEQEYEEMLFQANPELPKVFILFSSFRGLCGNFDTLIRRRLSEYITEHKDSEFAYIIVFGRRSVHWVRDMHTQKLEQFTIDKNEAEVLRNVAVQIKRMIMAEEVGQVDLMYTHLSGGVYFPVLEELLNSDISTRSVSGQESRQDQETGGKGTACEVEAIHDFMKEYLLENYLYAHLYNAYFDSICSENLARTFAMKQATKSAGEMIDRFTLAYNKERQARITQEVSEIVAGMKRSVKNQGEKTKITIKF